MQPGTLALYWKAATNAAKAQWTILAEYIIPRSKDGRDFGKKESEGRVPSIADALGLSNVVAYRWCQLLRHTNVSPHEKCTSVCKLQLVPPTSCHVESPGYIWRHCRVLTSRANVPEGLHREPPTHRSSDDRKADRETLFRAKVRMHITPL